MRAGRTLPGFHETARPNGLIPAPENCRSGPRRGTAAAMINGFRKSLAFLAAAPAIVAEWTVVSDDFQSAAERNTQTTANNFIGALLGASP